MKEQRPISTFISKEEDLPTIKKNV